MLKMICLLLALTSVALGGAITYDYTGINMLYCNGITNVNSNCPSNYTSDYVIASLTFNAPLVDNLSSANEATSPNLLGWSIHDVLNYASFSSSDFNAASELMTLSISTDGNGNIDGWNIQIGNIVNGVSGSFFFLTNPTIIGGGCGCAIADAPNFDGGNIAPDGWNASSDTPGQFTVATPEPSAFLLISSGLVTIFFRGQRTRRGQPAGPLLREAHPPSI